MKYPLEKEAENIMNMSRKAEFKQLMINRRNLYHLLSRFFQKEVDEEFFEIIQKIKFPGGPGRKRSDRIS